MNRLMKAMFRTVGVGLGVTALVGGLAVAVPATASAAPAVSVTQQATALVALAHCTASKSVSSGSATTVQPYYGPTGSRNCQLTEADNNAGVRTLQAAINACYGTKLTVDGDFGPNTRAALKSVQAAENRAGANPRLTVDGLYGPNTRTAMKWPVNVDGRPVGCSRLGI